MVNIDVWRQMLKLYEEIKSNHLIDVYKCYRQMREVIVFRLTVQNNYWVFSAVLRPSLAPQRIPGFDGQLQHEPLTAVADLSKLENIHRAYVDCKVVADA